MTESRRFLIVPCFNEEKRLQFGIVAQLPNLLECTVLLVDDGSTDATSQLLDQFCGNSNGAVQLLTLPRNVGKGEAVRSGLNWAIHNGASQIAYCDADFAVQPRDLARIFAELDQTKECKAVIGSRVSLLGTDIKRHFSRHIAGRIFATFASIILKVNVYDTQCGAKAFRCCDEVSSVFSEPFVSRWGFDVEILGRLLIKSRSTGLDQTIREIPLMAWTEVPGSRMRLGSRARTLGELLAIRKSLHIWSQRS